MYCSAQPSVFSEIVRNYVVINVFSLRNKINSLLCVVVVAATCLILSDKKSEILYDVDVIAYMN